MYVWIQAVLENPLLAQVRGDISVKFKLLKNLYQRGAEFTNNYGELKWDLILDTINNETLVTAAATANNEGTISSSKQAPITVPKPVGSGETEREQANSYQAK